MLDAHSHLSFLSDTALQAAIVGSNAKWILGGYDPADWARQSELQSQYPQRFLTSFGIHPWVVSKSSEEELNQMCLQLQSLLPEANFVGEIGLDFSSHQNPQSFPLQRVFFKKQLVEASSRGQPVVLHVVQAHAASIEMLDGVPASSSDVRGFVHGFSGTIEIAREYFKRGIWLSIGPGVLNPKYKKLREAIRQVELSGILIESDSPANHQQSAYDGVTLLPQILKEIATLRQMPTSELQEMITANSHRIWTRGRK